MMLKQIVYQWKRILSEPVFWVGAVVVFLLCMTQNCGYNGSDVREVWYYFLHPEFQFPKESMDPYCVSTILMNYPSVWLGEMIPMVVALSFVPTILTEKNSNFFRYEICRGNYASFYIARFIAVLLAGGCCVLTGYLLFSGAVFLRFPRYEDYSEEVRTEYSQFVHMINVYSEQGAAQIEKGSMAVLSWRCMEMFLYGCMAALPGLLCTILFKNAYVVIVTPYLCYYCLAQVGSRMISYAYRDFERPIDWMGKAGQIIQPLNHSVLFSRRYLMESVRWFCVCLIAVSFVVYLISSYRRTDRGEG